MGLRTKIYICIFILSCFFVASPGDWWMTFPKGWYKHMWKVPFETKIEEETHLKLGTLVVFLANDGSEAFGRVVKVYRTFNHTFVTLVNDHGMTEVIAEKGDWFNVTDVLPKKESLSSFVWQQTN